MSDQSYIPNVIIAGAPKCGTGSLFDWLSQHPSIIGSKPKEPFILMDVDHPLYNKDADFETNSWRCYESVFDKTSNGLYMEASTHYIYQDSIVDKLLHLPNKPKIIFSLRNPADRIYSSFQYSINNLASIESTIDFDEYIKQLLDSKALDFPDNPSGYVLKRDLKYGEYYFYLKKWFEKYPRELIKIVLFEDIKTNQEDVLKSVLNFLNLEHQKGVFNFSIKNETKSIKYSGLHRILHSLNRISSDNRIKKLVKRAYFKFQKGKLRQNMSNDSRRKLISHYRSSIVELEGLIEMDLKKWL